MGKSGISHPSHFPVWRNIEKCKPAFWGPETFYEVSEFFLPHFLAKAFWGPDTVVHVWCSDITK